MNISKSKVTLAVLTFAGLVASQAAHAVVADQFTCEIEILDKKTQTTVQSQTVLTGLRLPFNHSPSPDIRMTGTEIGFNSVYAPKNSDESVSVATTLKYVFAIQYDSNDQPIRASLWSCSSSGTDFGGESSVKPCKDPSSDPFDPKGSWMEVQIDSEGTPLLWGAGSGGGVENKDYKTNALCTYKGTVR